MHCAQPPVTLAYCPGGQPAVTALGVEVAELKGPTPEGSGVKVADTVDTEGAHCEAVVAIWGDVNPYGHEVGEETPARQ